MVEKVTIYDIAREAKVSIATVSRVLNGTAPVRESTRARVESAMEKYDFRPSIAARNLMNYRTGMIGVILPDIINPFFSTLFSNLQTYAVQQNYSLLLYHSMNDLDAESHGLVYLQQHQVDGLIFIGGRINRLHLEDHYARELKRFIQDIPTVFINGYVDGVECKSVCADEEGGIRQLVQYLVGLGHRDIALLGGVKEITSHYVKEKAFREIAAETGLQVRKDWIIPTDFTMQGGIEAMQQLATRKKQPTAVIGINDLVALGVVKYCHGHDIQIPEHLSVVGFDDIYITELTSPELTSVTQNYEIITATAIEEILKLINNQGDTDEIVVEMELVTRNSCKPLR